MSAVTVGTGALLGSAAIGATGSIMGGKAQAKSSEEAAKQSLQATREQIAENARQFGITSKFAQDTQAARQKAYEEAISRGAGQMGEGEAGFMADVNTANPELAQQQADILSGNAKGLQQASGQMSANLASQGIRGGQAGTLLGRATGEMGTAAQKDINAMRYTDAATRAAEKRAYEAAKAGRGQVATLPSGAI